MNLIIISVVQTSKLAYKCTGYACELCPTLPWFIGLVLNGTYSGVCGVVYMEVGDKHL